MANPLMSIFGGGGSNMFMQAIFASINGIVTPDGGCVVYASGDEIVVEGSANADVYVYDAVGRCMKADRERGCSTRRYRMPSDGVYIVKIGDNAPQRVVIVK